MAKCLGGGSGKGEGGKPWAIMFNGGGTKQQQQPPNQPRLGNWGRQGNWEWGKARSVLGR